MQKGRWWQAVQRAKDTSLRPAQRAEARIQAEHYERDIPKQDVAQLARSYKAPLIAGALEGAGVANVPQIHDLFLPIDNPERRAYEEYLKRLPLNHPEIQRTINLLKDMPKENPVREAALRHFFRRYSAIVTGVEGALEGAGGAALGNTATKFQHASGRD